MYVVLSISESLPPPKKKGLLSDWVSSECEYCFTCRFLHNHGNIATEGNPKPRLWPALTPSSQKKDGLLSGWVSKPNIASMYGQNDLETTTQNKLYFLKRQKEPYGQFNRLGAVPAFRRQIMKSKVDQCSERVNHLYWPQNHKHMYSNKAVKAK